MPSKTNVQSNSAKVEITAQGRLLTVKCYNPDEDWRPPGKRGNVEEFTQQSRMRMLRLIARVNPTNQNGFRHRCSFLTLTTKSVHHPRQFKKFLQIFWKRLQRKHKNVSCIWRLEYQKRGAPHLHLVIYNMPYIDKWRIQAVWGEIVDEEQPFTRIESVKTPKHLMCYVSKYAAKVESSGFNTVAYLTDNPDCQYKDESLGRVWGVLNRKDLPLALEEVEIVAQSGAWYMLRRYCQIQYPWIWEGETKGFTVFADDPYHAMTHMVKMYTLFEQYK